MMDTVPGLLASLVTPFVSFEGWRIQHTLFFPTKHYITVALIILFIWRVGPFDHFQIFKKYYPSSYLRQNILFLLLPPTNFEQDWVLYTVVCFHIMTKKMTGLVELNRQWELYFFTHLFSSTGLWWLLVLWLQFNINEICMLYLLVSNPCILSSGYNVSVKKTTLHLIS